MPTFSPSIFRAYDIRGVRETEVTKEFANLLGRSLVAQFKSKKVVVGFDARPGCGEFAPFLIEGITSQGADVLNLGMVPTELVPITAGLNNITEAVIITASHNPPQYVGFKLLTDKGSTGINDSNGRTDMRKMIENPDLLPKAKSQGAVTKHDPWPAYTELLFRLVPKSELQKPLTILGEAGNGMGGVLIDHLTKDLPIKLTRLLFEPDGNYPVHTPNPTLPHSREVARRAAKEHKYDLTVMLDGDADRVGFLDANGDYIPPDYFDTLIMDKIIHKEYPDSAVVSENRRAWSLDFGAKENGYKIIRTKTGYPNIKAGMKEHNAALGFETASGHTMYKDTFYAESSGLTFLYILKLLNEHEKTLSELIAPYRNQVVMVDEQNYHHNDAQKSMEALAAHFKGAKITYPDGLVMETSSWRASIRTSNTEPLLRLNLEARDTTTLQATLTEIDAVVQGSGGKKE